jgi:hypothetical protein
MARRDEERKNLAMTTITRRDRLLLLDLLANLEHAERTLRTVTELVDIDAPDEVRARVGRSLTKVKGAADAIFRFIRDQE